MAKTKNLGLEVTTDIDNPKFRDWRKAVAGNSLTSNMSIIDSKIGIMDTAIAGKEAKGHKHDTGDISSGILSIIHGGTGATTAVAARTALDAAPTSHNHTAISTTDSRNQEQNPTGFPAGLSMHLKSNSADGVNYGGIYHAVLGIKQWSDTSGGMFHQLAFCDSGMILHRWSTSGTVWGEWKKLYDEANKPMWGDVTGKPATFTPAGHATSHKTGGADALRAEDVGAESALTSAIAKAAVVDADGVVITDSAAGNRTKKLLWSAVKSTLKTYFDTLYNKYVHPAYTARAAGLYKVTVDAVGHVSAVTAVAKADITALGIPAQDTTYGVVTASANGLMATADKSKLDGIAARANNYSLPAATASVLGGVKVGTGLVVSSGTVSLGDIDGGTF